MRLRVTAVAAALSLTALAAVSTAPPVPAGGPLSTGGTPLFPGLERHQITFALPDGRPAVVNLLAFDPADPLLELRPTLGQDTVPGLETVVNMTRRKIPDGAVAGINAGFWLSNPVGDPNGYLAAGGWLVSEGQTQGSGPRGTYGLTGDGTVVMDRLDTFMTLMVNETNGVRVTGVNRHWTSSGPFPDPQNAVFLYTPHFGPAVAPVDAAPRPVRALVLADVQVSPSGWSRGTVNQAMDAGGGVPIPPSGTTVIAHGDAAVRLATARPGDVVGVHVDPRPTWTLPAEWDEVTSGLAAGPLLLKDGVMVDPGNWESEGFAPATHSNVRHPRSAIARADDGRVLLVTVDGRQPGYSHGMTLQELAHYLRILGVRDAVSLDGGGSTQLAIDGVLQNRPCCDRSLRPVATGLLVHHHYTFTATERLAGARREATAAAASAASHPGGSSEVLLAAAANFPDALAGGPLATSRAVPLLLTEPGRLSDATRAELRRLGARVVTILGGQAAISQDVERELVASGHVVRRVAGRDRADTAARIARELSPLQPRVVLAYQGDFPDALSAASPAGMLRMPILLTATDRLPASTREALLLSGVREAVIVGGTARVGPQVEAELQALGVTTTRLAGRSRFATARMVNEWASTQIPDLDSSGLVVATGGRFPDALAGGPLAASRRQLTMILPGTDVYRDEDTAAYLRFRGDRGLASVTILGGHGVVGSYEQWQLDQLAGG